MSFSVWLDRYRRMRSYLVILLGFMVSTLVLTGLVNWLVDPYAIWGMPRIVHWNSEKPQMVSHERVTKFAAWAALDPPPEKIILGTSRSLAIKTNHPAFGDTPTTYHMGLAAEPIRESALLFKHALAGGQLKLALISLDFFAFNAYYPTPLDENLQLLRPWGRYRLLISGDVLKDTWTTLKANRAYQGSTELQGEGNSAVGRPGDTSIRELFRKSEQYYAGPNYFPPPYRLNSCDNNLTGENSLNSLREILRLGYANHVDVRLFISPSHARQWELLANVGLWEKWERWKRDLVRVNAEEATRAGAWNPFPLWDFSGYNSITTESVPDIGNRQPMQWYHESSHFKADCADLIVDRIFNSHGAAVPVPRDFGTAIDENNIDTHLEHIRQYRQRYVSSHPQDEQDVVAEVAQVNH